MGAAHQRAASVPIMDLDDVMRCAPTTRRFLAEPVDDEVLRGVLDKARFAPSGGNRQRWRVIAVRIR